MALPSNNSRAEQGRTPSTKKRELPVIPASPLPPLYAAWIDQLLAGPIPSETDATCDDCAMLPSNGEAQARSSTFFNPATKCCSYIPQLPNYLVGRILSDEDPAFAAGHSTVAARLSAGVAVTPLGLDPPPHFQVLYGASATTLFGQSRSLRCPHYLADEGGRCGVWKHRASVCATWHCKYVRGRTGQDFWQTLNQLLSTVEQSLAKWCVHEIDPGGAALKLLFSSKQQGAKNQVDPAALDGAPQPAKKRALWGEWAGREADYYRACAHLVESLTWPEVLAISGPEARIYARLTQAAYQELIAVQLPLALKVGSFQCVRVSADTQVVNSYSPYDPIELPWSLFEVLPYFEGRSTRQALAAIRTERGIKINDSLVRKLIDFNILVPVAQQPAWEDIDLTNSINPKLLN